MAEPQMYHATDEKSLVNSPRVFVMTDTIYRAILRNKLNIIDAINYNRLRNIASVDDLAELWHLNTNPLKSSDSSISVDLCSWMFMQLFATVNTLTDSESNEIQNTIQPLSGSILISDTVRNKLSDDNIPSEGTGYQLLLNNNIVFVVLETGFLTRMQNVSYRLEFYRDLLKKLYMVNRISDVSNLALFHDYLKTLYLQTNT